MTFFQKICVAFLVIMFILAITVLFMYREIKFRGLSKDTNKWVYGFLWGSIDPQRKETKYRGWYIYTGVNIDIGYKIYEDTAGQFTGLKDCEEREIYEGDIVKYFLPQADPAEEPIEYIEEIIFEDGCFNVDGAPLYAAIDWEAEVIGNIYEHKHLLKS